MARFRYIALLLVVVINSFAQHHHASEDNNTPAGKPIAIIIFMAVDCPVTQKYMNTIKSIALRYQGEISVTGYFPAGLTRKTEKQFRREYNIPDIIRLVDDKAHQATEKFGATITPEVFLISESDKVLYSGAIDNWFFELGRYRVEITENYLLDAIEATKKGNMPPITRTEAVGCFIQKLKGNSTHQH